MGSNSLLIKLFSGDIYLRQRQKQQEELQPFHEKLRDYADNRISLDLDDSMKVNCSKFADLLAELKAVTGKKVE